MKKPCIKSPARKNKRGLRGWTTNGGCCHAFVKFPSSVRRLLLWLLSFLKSGCAAAGGRLRIAIVIALRRVAAGSAIALGDHDFGRHGGASFFKCNGYHGAGLDIRNAGFGLCGLLLFLALIAALSVVRESLFYDFCGGIDGIFHFFHVGSIGCALGSGTAGRTRRSLGGGAARRVWRTLRGAAGGLRGRILRILAALLAAGAASVHFSDLYLRIADRGDDASDASVILGGLALRAGLRAGIGARGAAYCKSKYENNR